MGNGLISLVDPDIFETNTLPGDTGIFRRSEGSGRILQGIGVFDGKRVLRGAGTSIIFSYGVTFEQRPTGKSFGFSAVYSGSSTSSTVAFRIGVFPLDQPVSTSHSNGVFVEVGGGNARIVGGPGGPPTNLQKVLGRPDTDPRSAHIEARFEYSLLPNNNIEVSAELYYDGDLWYFGTGFVLGVSITAVDQGEFGIAVPQTDQVRMISLRDIVYYDADIIEQPLGITKVRQVLTDVAAIHPPIDDSTSLTVLPVAVELTLSDQPLGNILAGGLFLRAGPQVPGEISELIATVRSADGQSEQSFTTGNLPLFVLRNNYFPITEVDGNDLYNGKLILQSRTPDT